MSLLGVLSRLVLGTIFVIGLSAHAEGKKVSITEIAPGAKSSGTTAEKGEKIDVEGLRQKYWSQGEKSDMAVIQNRQYSKAQHVEIGILGGALSSDPFLSVKSVGGRIGYYFKETLAIEVIGWKAFSSNSSAFDALQAQGLTVQTNKPKGFVGGGIDYCPIYGKLSFFGSSILHFDLGVKAGAGLTMTETGNYFTPYLGVGQRLYLTKAISLTFEYKVMYYSENIRANTNPAAGLGPMLKRTNWTNGALVGVGLLF